MRKKIKHQTLQILSWRCPSMTATCNRRPIQLNMQAWYVRQAYVQELEGARYKRPRGLCAKTFFQFRMHISLR